VRHEIRPRHIAGQDESSRPAEEADQQQHAAYEFDDPLQAFEREKLQVVELRLVRHPEKLGRTVHQEQ